LNKIQLHLSKVERFQKRTDFRQEKLLHIHIHFSPIVLRLRLQVFGEFYCAWNFLKLRKTCKNADAPFEVGVQFLAGDVVP
jgi:hypothetical protein